jgi:DNA invertase Pin-like site-specific DNA recombinase
MSFHLGNTLSGLRAAQYVRMSTDHQKYSTQNQSTAIAAFAAQRNITIVRSYADEGRSGLRISGRAGLRELIADVQFGQSEFDCILVYDVSRWGRFQDVDESAYYEFICKKAGIRVHYCADEFENDGSLASTILKTVKRIAAADYSRLLSTKVFMGQCRITELGFWHGGPAGYGLRRLLIDEHGAPRCLLGPGQRKFLQTDRVVLKPGPSSEVKIVKQIFKSFVTHGKTVTDIAAELNARQIPTSRGKRWEAQLVDNVLQNESYMGNLVYNRTSYKLRQKAVRNPPEMWVRREKALDPIIPPQVFAKAQELIRKRLQNCRLSDQEALDRLLALWRKKGYLTSRVIVSSDGVPDTSTYIKHFGSLMAAYKRIGYQPKTRYRWVEVEHRIRSMIDAVLLAEIVSNLENRGRNAAFDPNTRLLTFDHGQLSVSVGSARCVRSGGRLRWFVRIDRSARTDIALVFRMDTSNSQIQNYYLLPSAELAQLKAKRLCVTNRDFHRSYRLDNLEALYRICNKKGW